MSAQFETGHGKNVANLFKFNQFLEDLGGKYSPVHAAITLPAMQTLYTNAKLGLDTAKDAEEKWKDATNRREIIFDALGVYVTRVLGVFRSLAVPQQTIDDLAFLVAKIRGNGRKSGSKKTDAVVAANTDGPALPITVTRSSSQLSFDNRIENFSKIILLLQGVPGYTPTEADLSLAGLQAHYALMVDVNNKATEAEIKLKTARDNRNTYLYASETGAIDLIKKSKAYILGVFGRTSKQYINASSFKFTRPKN